MEFSISRELDSPRETVWKAWTTQEALYKWWGPKECTITDCDLDLRVGGTFFYGMEFSNGTEMWGIFKFDEIIENEKLVYRVSFADKDRNAIRAPFSETWPLETLNTVTFEDHNGGTRLHLVSAPHNANEHEIKTFNGMFESMKVGFGGTMMQLAAYLKGEI